VRDGHGCSAWQQRSSPDIVLYIVKTYTEFEVNSFATDAFFFDLHDTIKMVCSSTQVRIILFALFGCNGSLLMHWLLRSFQIPLLIKFKYQWDLYLLREVCKCCLIVLCASVERSFVSITISLTGHKSSACCRKILSRLTDN